MGKLITIGDIRLKLGVSTRQRADQISRQRGFPLPAQMAGNYRLWDEDEVDAWMDANRPNWRGDQPPA